MTSAVSMLRGVNVGRNHRIRMEALRALYLSLGLKDPRTCLQSGNVVFLAGERDLAPVARRIEEAIERAFGFHSDVLVRTRTELSDAVARNPFTSSGIEPGKLLVVFLSAAPGADARQKVLALNTGPEQLRIDGREMYIYFPDGMARPKLSLPALEKAMKTPGTGRNWNTVNKLLEMAEKMESSRHLGAS